MHGIAAGGGDRSRKLRSWLLVPEEAGLEAAIAAGPDSLVLEAGTLWGGPEWIAPRLEHPRAEGIGPALFLRIDSLSGFPTDVELAIIERVRPDGVMFAAEGARDVVQLGARLAVIEAEHGAPDGATRIVASIETARGALHLPGLAQAGPRLLGITTAMARLAEDLGCETGSGHDLPETIRHVRGVALLVAAAAGCIPIAGAEPPRSKPADFGAARRDGFRARLTREPGEVAAINAAFDPITRHSDG